jgi:dCMP deaminase
MGHVLATGYNGVARGQPHCNTEKTEGRDFVSVGKGVEIPQTIVTIHPHSCPSANAPSGQSLDGCQAIHAEQNALLQCNDVEKIYSCFTTTSPCMTCVKLLMNTSCVNIFFVDEYPHPEAKDLWLSGIGRTWTKLAMPEVPLRT